MPLKIDTHIQTPIDTDDREIAERDKPEPRQQELEASVLGRYIRIYNKRLRVLSKELEDTRQQFGESLANIERRITDEIEGFKAEIRKLPDEVESLVDTRVDTRLDGFVGRGEADLQKLSTLINDFARDFQSQIDRLSGETKLLQEQTRRNHETLRADLTSETETLETAKVDRLTLSEALITLGMKLKEENLFNEFGADLDLDEVLEAPEA